MALNRQGFMELQTVTAAATKEVEHRSKIGRKQKQLCDNETIE